MLGGHASRDDMSGLPDNITYLASHARIQIKDAQFLGGNMTSEEKLLHYEKLLILGKYKIYKSQIKTTPLANVQRILIYRDIAA